MQLNYFDGVSCLAIVQYAVGVGKMYSSDSDLAKVLQTVQSVTGAKLCYQDTQLLV